MVIKIDEHVVVEQVAPIHELVSILSGEFKSSLLSQLVLSLHIASKVRVIAEVESTIRQKILNLPLSRNYRACLLLFVKWQKLYLLESIDCIITKIADFLFDGNY